MKIKNILIAALVAMSSIAFLAPSARADLDNAPSSVNQVQLKADSANAAPCSVYGSPYNTMKCSNFAVGVASESATGQQGTAQDATHGLYASSQVVVNASFETLLSSGGLVLNTATPSISTSAPSSLATTNIPNGMILVLTSTAASGGMIFQDNGTLSGSQLELGAATRQVSLNKTLTLIFVSALKKWLEISYGNN